MRQLLHNIENGLFDFSMDFWHMYQYHPDLELCWLKVTTSNRKKLPFWSALTWFDAHPVTRQKQYPTGEQMLTEMA